MLRLVLSPSAVCVALLAAPAVAIEEAPAPAPALGDGGGEPVGDGGLPEVKARVDTPAPPTRNWVNLRAGVGSTSAATSMQTCLEVTPTEDIGVDLCGNGSGFLHADDAPELALFRAKLRGPSYESDAFAVEPWLGVGFAELQVGADAPGFYFFDTGPRGVETAGPVVTGSARVVVPLAAGVDAVAELSLGAAYLAQAPTLSQPQDPWQALVSFTAGMGF